MARIILKILETVPIKVNLIIVYFLILRKAIVASGSVNPLHSSLPEMINSSKIT